MAPRYQLTTHAHFCAAHLLRGYEGSCARLHGHNYKVVVDVEVTALDPIGIGVDFRDIRAAVESVAAELDHRYLNEIPPFDEMNPTSENLAAHLFRRIAGLLDRPRARVGAVTLWETERSCVRYSEPSED